MHFKNLKYKVIGHSVTLLASHKRDQHCIYVVDIFQNLAFFIMS
jgi:hypothetical protein